MNFKEFLKPTLAKIIITLIIFLFILFAPIIKVEIYSFIAGGGGVYYESLFTSLRSGIEDYLLIILFIVISYLISCILMSIFNLIKKRT